jgi:hypothetical protein
LGGTDTLGERPSVTCCADARSVVFIASTILTQRLDLVPLVPTILELIDCPDRTGAARKLGAEVPAVGIGRGVEARVAVGPTPERWQPSR